MTYHPRDIKNGRVWIHHDRSHNFKMLEDHLDFENDTSDRRILTRYAYVLVTLAAVGVLAWLTK